MHSLYTFTVPVFEKTLGGLKQILQKAKSHIAAQGLDEAAFLEKRLAPDMFPLSRQVQIACDNAKSVARLSGMEPPAHEDTEKTIDELIARIDKTIAFTQTLTEASFEGGEDRRIVLPYFHKVFPGKYLQGFDYAREQLIPNFFFHVSMAYAIARLQGVEIGKADYINGLNLQDIQA
jgi:hypothetical protein